MVMMKAFIAQAQASCCAGKHGKEKFQLRNGELFQDQDDI